MTPDEIKAAILEAARLTRAGQPLGATALIRRTLQDRAAQPAAAQGVRVAQATRLQDARPELSSLRAGEIPQQRAPGRFVGRSFADRRGERAYKLYLPGSWQGQALPLVVMLHGCSQNPDDFAAGTGMNKLAEDLCCFVLYPEQAPKANGSRCWNWFEAAHQQRDRGEPALIAGITRRVMGEHPVESGRVYVAGLSAGGAMAAVMGQTYPDLYRALGIHSGLACGAASDLSSALVAMRQGRPGPASAGRYPPTIVFHGDQDATVHPRNGELVARAASRAGATPTVLPGRSASGRRYTRTLYRDGGGLVNLEHWLIHGLGHAWSGGSTQGSFTDPNGPDASREMLRFFLEQP